MMEPRAIAIGKAASKCCTMGSLGDCTFVYLAINSDSIA